MIDINSYIGRFRENRKIFLLVYFRIIGLRILMDLIINVDILVSRP